MPPGSRTPASATTYRPAWPSCWPANTARRSPRTPSASTAGTGIIPILVGLATGAVFGTVFAAAGYAATRGRRDFASSSQLVAGRYDVLCQPRHAEQARDMLAKLAMGPGPAPA